MDCPLVWAAAGVGKPAGRAPWTMNWGHRYQDGQTVLGYADAPGVNDLLDMGYLLGEVSSLVYDDEPDPRALGFTLKRFIKPEAEGIYSPEAMVLEGMQTPLAPRSVVVAIRGSSSLADVVVDLAARAQSDKDVTYHTGFHDYAGAVYGDIEEAVRPYCGDPRTKIWVTGHSLGGAAAQIIAYWLSSSNCPIQGVVTFAAPTPGQGDFREAYRALQNGNLHHNTHRFAHQFDTVPCLPTGKVWKDVGVRHVIYGGDFKAADKEPYLIHLSGATPYTPPNPPVCEEDADGVVVAIDNFVDQGFEHALDACPDGRGWRIASGILTLGASELTCTTAEYTARVTDVLEQVGYDLLGTKEGRLAVLSHKMGEGYLPAFVDAVGLLDVVGTDRPQPF